MWNELDPNYILLHTKWYLIDQMDLNHCFYGFKKNPEIRAPLITGHFYSKINSGLKSQNSVLIKGVHIPTICTCTTTASNVYTLKQCELQILCIIFLPCFAPVAVLIKRLRDETNEGLIQRRFDLIQALRNVRLAAFL